MAPLSSTVIYFWFSCSNHQAPTVATALFQLSLRINSHQCPHLCLVNQLLSGFEEDSTHVHVRRILYNHLRPIIADRDKKSSTPETIVGSYSNFQPALLPIAPPTILAILCFKKSLNIYVKDSNSKQQEVRSVRFYGRNIFSF